MPFSPRVRLQGPDKQRFSRGEQRATASESITFVLLSPKATSFKFRYKTLIGPTLRSRKFEAQQVEARVACSVINRMTELGMPISQRVR